jgi:hypothetical protein
MVGQHDTARAHANVTGAACYVTYNDSCGGARDTPHIMMFSNPETPRTKAFGVLCQFKAVVQGYASRAALSNRYQVKN